MTALNQLHRTLFLTGLTAAMAWTADAGDSSLLPVTAFETFIDFIVGPFALVIAILVFAGGAWNWWTSREEGAARFLNWGLWIAGALILANAREFALVLGITGATF